MSSSLALLKGLNIPESETSIVRELAAFLVIVQAGDPESMVSAVETNDALEVIASDSVCSLLKACLAYTLRAKLRLTCLGSLRPSLSTSVSFTGAHACFPIWSGRGHVLIFVGCDVFDRIDIDTRQRLASICY